MTIRKILPRRGTAAAWTAANPVLANGEMGYETDTRKLKRGNGVTAWNSLAYSQEAEASAILPELATAAVTADIAARDWNAEDAGGGDVQFTVGGDPIGDPFTLPAATWSGVTGAPGYLVTGTVGDGSTDDRAALNTSNTSAVAAHLPLILPAGTYKVSSTLTFTTPVWFLPGAILKPDSGIVVTLTGGISGNPMFKFIDTSAGGVVTFRKVDFVRPEWWGAVADGSTDCTAAIQAAVDSSRKDYTSYPVPVRLVGGTYKVTGTIDARCTASGSTQWDDFKGIIGTGRESTQIVQYTSNVPIFRLSGRYFAAKGFSAKFSTIQTVSDIAGNVFDFEDWVYNAIFDDLLLEGGYIGINSKDGDRTDVGSALFSNSYGNIRFRNNRYIHWRFSASGGPSAGGTGNLQPNIYMSSPDVDRMYRGVERFGGFEDHWTQLNIEHTNFEDCAIYDTAGDSLTIDNLHMEGLSFFCPTGNRAVVATNGKGRVRIDAGIDHCYFGPRKVSGITRSGTTATATVDLLDSTVAHHGLRVGDTVVVDGANETDYNITATVTAVPSNTTFQYTVANSPTTPATLGSGNEHMTVALGAAFSGASIAVVRANQGAENIDMDLRIRDVRVIEKNQTARATVLRVAYGAEHGARVRMRSLSTRGQIANAQLLDQVPLVALSRASNVATAYTRTPHRLCVGDTVYINTAASGFTSTATVVDVLGPHKFTYNNTGANASTVRVTSGNLFMKTYGTTHRARTSNICTLTLGTHSLVAGMRIRVSNISGYTGSGQIITILSATSTTISYLSSGSDEATTADATGIVMLLDSGLNPAYLTEPSASPVLTEADWLYAGCEALDLGTITAGSAATQTTTHYGVRAGDQVVWTPDAALPDGLQLQVSATAADTITWRAYNPTGGNIVSGVNVVRYKFGRG